MLNRIDAVAQRFHSRDTKGYCDVPEAAEKFREALRITKGRTNNELAMRIASRDTSTVEDIIRLAEWKEDGKVPEWEQVVKCTAQRKMDDWAKRRRSQEMKFPKLEETMFAKILQKKGLWGYAQEMNISNASMVNLTGDGARYWANERKAFSTLMAFAINNTERITKYAPRYLKNWSRAVNVSTPENMAGITATLFKAKKAMFKYELDTINELPQEVLERIQLSKHEPESFASCYFGTTVPRTEYYAELAKMFLEAMEYMGLGVYCDWMDSDWPRSLPSFRAKGIVPVCKKVLSSVKSFNSMVKKGFDPNLVRDEIVQLLNNYVQQVCKVHWVFVKRANARMEYPELETAKKKSAKKSTAKSTTKAEKTDTLSVGGMTLRIRE